jgi:Mg/Co/Ni transporter MgtE
MHLGQFIKNEVEKRGMTLTHAGKMMNKSGTGVAKDFTKESLTQEVIKAWSKLLDINIFKILADEYEGKTYTEVEEDNEPEIFEDSEEPKKMSPINELPIQVVSVNILIPAEKQEAVLKLLMT